MATDCTRHVYVRAEWMRASPCTHCTIVLSSWKFTRAIKKPAPSDKNYKFNNEMYRNEALGELYIKIAGLRKLLETDSSASPFLRYAAGLLEGKYQDNKILSGLLQSVKMEQDRAARGVGKQNFRWPVEYDHFINLLRIESPRAYRLLSKHLPTRSERSYQALEAKQPRLPMKICDTTFDLLCEHLTALNYVGPVALSCDDTKLHPAWRLYWDKEESAHFLIGGVDGPLRVPDPESVQEIIDQKSDSLGTKVRLWVTQVPLPKVAPIVVAAMPISKDFPAERLSPMTETIIRNLIKRKVKVVSYACDGTEVERSVQRLLLQRADTQKIFRVAGLKGNKYDLEVPVAVFGDQAVVTVQDSKHGLKTFRNNLYSGARLITNGNFVATYRNIRTIAYEDNSPLYHRNVDKLDRQDDNAACRLFSATTLEYLTEHHPDCLGEIVYLFIFGELVDAYQNRFLVHAERLRLVLRAHYFLIMWQTYLQEAGYTESRYFLSREAADITRILINGLFALIMVHRDTAAFHSEGPFPFLPWLHSSEPCEHVFGCAHQVVKDFTVFDLYYMVRKLRVKIRDAVLLSESSDPRAQARGYNHTYFDNRGLDMHALATYPSDSEVQQVASQAFEEAESLMALLGINAELLHDQPLRSGRVQSTVSFSEPTVVLPSIASWYLSNDDEDPDSEDDEPDDAAELRHLLLQEQLAYKTDQRTEREDVKLLNLTMAAVSLSIDDLGKAVDMADLTASEQAEFLAEECHAIEDAFKTAATSLPEVQAADEQEKPFGKGSLTGDVLDLTQLVNLRRLHETVQAAKGVRTRSANAIEKPEQTLRRELVRQFYDVLRSQQDRGIGTGCEREARWCESSHHAGNGTGNSANAASVAKAAASRNVQRRKRVFTQVKISSDFCDDIVTARVSHVRLLRVHDFGVILIDGRLTIAKVLALYVKTNGKHGKHASVDDTQTIGAVSYLAVQVFEQFSTLNQFRAMTRATAKFQTFQYALIPSTAFLAVLTGAPKVQVSSITLEDTDWCLYKSLRDQETLFAETIKLFRQRGGPADDLS